MKDENRRKLDSILSRHTTERDRVLAIERKAQNDFENVGRTFVRLRDDVIEPAFLDIKDLLDRSGVGSVIKSKGEITDPYMDITFYVYVNATAASDDYFTPYFSVALNRGNLSLDFQRNTKTRDGGGERGPAGSVGLKEMTSGIIEDHVTDFVALLL